MKTLTSLLAGATLIALMPAASAAADSDMSVAVHDILVTSSIPAINVSVRNLSPSPFPAMRNLRVTSPRPMVRVAGQVWCKAFQTAHIRADAAQVMFGNASLYSLPEGGAGIHPLGIWSSSPVQALGADELVRNYSINAPVDFPDHWNGGISFGFNPVREVEKRMEQFVQNGAGTEADFLRVDDVFETTIKVNAVGWCDYDSGSHQYRYAGYRQIDVPVHIFYHGDEDIEDQVTAVGSSGTIQAPPPPRGPSFAPPPGRRGRNAAPPPRRAQPSRPDSARRPDREREPAEAEGGVSIASGDLNGDESVGLLVPAIQRQHEPVETRGAASSRRASPSRQDGTRRPDREREPAEAHGDVFIAIPDIDSEDTEALLVPAIQRQHEPVETRGAESPRRSDDTDRSGIGDIIRREAARAAIGALLGSGRSSRSSSPEARPAPRRR